MSRTAYVRQRTPSVVSAGAGPTVRERGRHTAASFVALSYAITWLIWLPLAIDPALALPESRWRVLYHLGFLGPMLAAVVIAASADGPRGLAALVEQLRPRRERLPWIVLGAALPFVLWLASVILSRTLFAVMPPPVFLLGAWIDLPGFGAVAGWLFILTTVGIGAEVGWRGFLLSHLQRTRQPIEAMMLVTLAWTVWHIPLFHLDPTYHGLTSKGLGVWFLALLGASTVLTWLFNRSRGSTLACALFHGATTSIWMSWAVAEPIGWGMGAMMVLLGLGLSRRVQQTPPVAWEPDRATR